MFASWKAIYDSQAQGLWALIAAPALLLVWLALRGGDGGGGVAPFAARLVRLWTIVFAAAAVFDPIATGVLGWHLAPFVLLGDYRVFALVLVVMQPGRSRVGALVEAALWSCVVPVVAFPVYWGLRALRPVPDTILWIVYESAFALLALGLLVWLLPARVGPERPAVRRYVAAMLGYVALYYALWAVSDVMVLAGRDAGWAVRIVANQLYYDLFVPVAYWRFFAARYSVSSPSTQAAR